MNGKYALRGKLVIIAVLYLAEIFAFGLIYEYVFTTDLSSFRFSELEDELALRELYTRLLASHAAGAIPPETLALVKRLKLPVDRFLWFSLRRDRMELHAQVSMPGEGKPLVDHGLDVTRTRILPFPSVWTTECFEQKVIPALIEWDQLKEETIRTWDFKSRYRSAYKLLHGDADDSVRAYSLEEIAEIQNVTREAIIIHSAFFDEFSIFRTGRAVSDSLSFNYINEKIASRFGIWTFAYFSVITQTTTGYGGIKPSSSIARILVAAQLIGSILLLSVGVAFILQRARTEL